MGRDKVIVVAIQAPARSRAVFSPFGAVIWSHFRYILIDCDDQIVGVVVVERCIKGDLDPVVYCDGEHVCHISLKDLREVGYRFPGIAVGKCRPLRVTQVDSPDRIVGNRACHVKEADFADGSHSANLSLGIDLLRIVVFVIAGSGQTVCPTCIFAHLHGNSMDKAKRGQEKGQQHDAKCSFHNISPYLVGLDSGI